MSTAGGQTVMPGSWRAWWMACRPPTLFAAAAPVLVGSAAAVHAGLFQPLVGLAALAGAVLIQIGTNFVNDVADFEKGTDTAERVGPVRTVQAGLLTPRAMRRGTVVAFASAVLAGTYLVSVGGWPIVAIGIASILSGIAYTAGPYPLGYHGLGDVFVFLFFGWVAVVCTYFLHTGAVALPVVLSGTALGALATNILVVNNIRDRLGDVLTGKRTLAVRWGRRAVEWEFRGMLAIAYAVPLLYWLAGWSGPQALLPLVTFPLALKAEAKVRALEGKALNPVLGQCARLLLLFSILHSVSLVWDGR